MNMTREYEVNSALKMGFQAALLGFDKVALREQIAQEIEEASVHIPPEFASHLPDGSVREAYVKGIIAGRKQAVEILRDGKQYD